MSQCIWVSKFLIGYLSIKDFGFVFFGLRTFQTFAPTNALHMVHSWIGGNNFLYQ